MEAKLSILQSHSRLNAFKIHNLFCLLFKWLPLYFCYLFIYFFKSLNGLARAYVSDLIHKGGMMYKNGFTSILENFNYDKKLIRKKKKNQ